MSAASAVNSETHAFGTLACCQQLHSGFHVPHCTWARAWAKSRRPLTSVLSDQITGTARTDFSTYCLVMKLKPLCTVRYGPANYLNSSYSLIVVNTVKSAEHVRKSLSLRPCTPSLEPKSQQPQQQQHHQQPERYSLVISKVLLQYKDSSARKSLCSLI